MNLEKILTNEDIVSSINNNLDYILDVIPELRFELNFPHNHPHHHLDVWNHTLLALSYSNNNFKVRLALLLHDIGKPFSYQDEEVRHFHGHAEVSSTMSEIILKRLGYEDDFIKEISYLIKYHDTAITEEEIDKDPDLMLLRLHIQECDSRAHHPDYQQKRLDYIESVKEMIRGKYGKERTKTKILTQKKVHQEEKRKI